MKKACRKHWLASPPLIQSSSDYLFLTTWWDHHCDNGDAGTSYVTAWRIISSCWSPTECPCPVRQWWVSCPSPAAVCTVYSLLACSVTSLKVGIKVSVKVSVRVGAELNINCGSRLYSSLFSHLCNKRNTVLAKNPVYYVIYECIIIGILCV